MMIPADTFGWIAAALMVATFSCRDPLWMRPLAVCTNLAFIAYACIAGLAPVLALHALLLPINLMRWWQSAREYRWARRLGLAAVFTVAAVATAGFSTDAVPDQVLFTAIK